MTPQQAFKAYREWFTLKRLVVRTCDVGDDWFGMYLPGPRSGTILVNLHHADTPRLVVGTVLHELIHAEQHALGMKMDHGPYFQQRRAELRKKGDFAI